MSKCRDPHLQLLPSLEFPNSDSLASLIPTAYSFHTFTCFHKADMELHGQCVTTRCYDSSEKTS